MRTSAQFQRFSESSLGPGIPRKRALREDILPALVRNALSVAALLTVVATGCSRSLAPGAGVGAGTHDASRGFGIAPPPLEPGPAEPAPPEAGPPTLAPSPSARFSDPRPSHLLVPTLTPTYTFRWSPDVPIPGGPVPTRYRYRMFDEHGTDFDFVTILVRPDSLLRSYAPAFAGWTEVDGSVTQATLTDMDPQQAHVIVLIAMDDHGHFDNVASLDKNMVYFHVMPALVTDTNRGTR